MISGTSGIKAIKVIGLFASVAIGVTMAYQGQVEMGVGLITAALSSPGLNSVQGNSRG